MISKKVITISLVAVFALGIFIINMVFGNPISKRAAQKQYLHYFENTYNEDFVVYDRTPGTIVYDNHEYGFSFTLPASWQNYTVVTDKWEGVSLTTGEGGKVVAAGQIIKIRHPLWSAQVPRQDIPIMIFTISQWQLVQNEKISVGAAPIPPGELGRNSQYIFALPARYNYAFPAGFEEVERIMAKSPLHPDENYDPNKKTR